MLINPHYQSVVNNFELSPHVLVLSSRAHYSRITYVDTLVQEVYANIMGELNRNSRLIRTEVMPLHLIFEKACYLKVQILDECGLQPNTAKLIKSASPEEKAIFNSFLEQLFPYFSSIPFNSLKTATLLFGIPRIHQFVISQWFHLHEFDHHPSSFVSCDSSTASSYTTRHTTTTTERHTTPLETRPYEVPADSFNPSPMPSTPFYDFSIGQNANNNRMTVHFFFLIKHHY